MEHVTDHAAAAAKMIEVACRELGASPSTCDIVPGLFLAQLEHDAVCAVATADAHDRKTARAVA